MSDNSSMNRTQGSSTGPPGAPTEHALLARNTTTTTLILLEQRWSLQDCAKQVVLTRAQRSTGAIKPSETLDWAVQHPKAPKVNRLGDGLLPTEDERQRDASNHG